MPYSSSPGSSEDDRRSILRLLCREESHLSRLDIEGAEKKRKTGTPKTPVLFATRSVKKTCNETGLPFGGLKRRHIQSIAHFCITMQLSQVGDSSKIMF